MNPVRGQEGPRQPNGAAWPIRGLCRGRTLWPLRCPGGLRALVILVLAGTSGCFSGSLGDRCEDEFDCASGLRCFTPQASSGGICTVGCAETPCSSGACITTDDGQVCAAECQSHADCSDSLACRAAPSGDSVCWAADSNLEDTPDGVVVADVRLTEDGNGDGILSPGERGSVAIYARNTGTSAALDVSPSITVLSPGVTLGFTGLPECTAMGESGSTDSCDGSPNSCTCTRYGHDLDPGETSSNPLVTLRLSIPANFGEPSARLQVTFTDEIGLTWTGVAEVPIAASGATVEVAEVRLTEDGNGDGILSPGERGSVAIYARNTGTSAALDVSPSITVLSPGVTLGFTGLPECTAMGESGSTDSCDGSPNSCTCTRYGHDLDPGETSSNPLVTLRVSIPADFDEPSARFEITFTDEIGLTWTEMFGVDAR